MGCTQPASHRSTHRHCLLYDSRPDSRLELPHWPLAQFAVIICEPCLTWRSILRMGAVERRGRLLGLIALIAAAELAFAFLTNIAAARLPQEWQWIYNPLLVWGILGALFVLLVAGTVVRFNHERQISDSLARTADKSPSVIGVLPGRSEDWVPMKKGMRGLRGHSNRRSLTAATSVVLGESGCGKSQLVGEYARRRARSRWLVIWIDASTRSSVELELSAAAWSLGLTEDRWDTSSAADALRDFLQSRRDRALLVFDGAVAREHFDRWIPTIGRVHTVITSVFDGLGGAGKVIRASGFTQESASKYLRRRLPSTSRSERDDLVRAVGSRPSSLWSATGVIQRERLRVDEYIGLFECEPVKEMMRDPGQGNSPMATISTIEHSIRSYRADFQSGTYGQQSSVDIIAMAALISPVHVDVRLLEASGGGRARSALAGLVDWSLATWTSEHQGILMHDLPARACRESMSSDEIGRVVMRFVDLARGMGPLVGAQGSKAHPSLDYNLRAAESVWRSTRRWLRGAARTKLLRLRLDFAQVSFTQGNFVTARAVAESVARETQPPREDRTSLLHLEALGHEAHAALAAGDKGAAIVSYRECVNRYQRTKGALDPGTLGARIGLGHALRADGQLSEAQDVFESILAYEFAPGDILRDANSGLGFVLLLRGEPRAAANLLRQVLQEYQARPGLDGTQALAVLNNLGRCLLLMKDASSVPVLREAYEKRTAQLGADHPQTLISSHYLGEAELLLGDRGEARRQLRETLERRRRVLGATHALTLKTQQLLESSNDPAVLRRVWSFWRAVLSLLAGIRRTED